MSDKPRLLDLFSGAGGFSLGFERAGFETIAFSEIEPFPCKVLAHRWPDVPNLGDVTKITEEQIKTLGEIDVVTFGSPCQDWSVAGKRLGLKGHRSSLFHEALRIVRAARPRFTVFENVPGLFSSAGGWDFAAVLDEMEESGALDIAWSVLDAQWFGVPQRRRRVFVVCDFRGESAGEILSISEGVFRNLEKSGEEGEKSTEGTRDGVAKPLGGGQDPRGWMNDLDHATYLPEVAGSLSSRYGKGVNTTADDGALVFDRHQFGGYRQTSLSGPLKETGYKDAEGLVAEPQSEGMPLIPFNYLEDDFGDESETTAPSQTAGRGEGRTAIVEATGFYANSGYKEDPVSGADAPLKGSKENAGQAAIAVRTAQTSANGHGVAREPSHALDGTQGQAVAFAENQRGELRTSDTHPQSTAGGGKPGQGYPAVAQPTSVREDQRTGAIYEMPYFSAVNQTGGKPGQGYAAVREPGMAVRRLTPKECERLQGFRDDWTNIPGASDSGRYRAMGNAVAVPVIHWIANRMNSCLESA